MECCNEGCIKMSDLISVIIPTFNRADLIGKSISSVLNQTYKNFELIIVDDGSTDNTFSVVKGFEDQRIKYIKQENSGACCARNNGINHSNGKYIAFHDSDDIWHDDKLQSQLDCILRVNADVVCCRMNRYFEDGFVRKEPYSIETGFLSKDMSPLGISTQTIFGKAEVFKTLLFDECMPRLQDFEIMLRILKKYNVYVMEEAKVDGFVQSDSISLNPKKLYFAIRLLVEKHIDIMNENKMISNQLGENLMRVIPEITFSDRSLRKEMASLSLKLNKTVKNLICYFMFRIHLYDFYYKLVKNRRLKKYV